MPVFFVDKSTVYNDKVIISDINDYNHLRNSLRVKINETIIVSTGSELEYHCKICDIDDSKKTITGSIFDITKNAAEPIVNMVLFQCIPKLDKMDTVIQKNVELGIHKIVPVISSRIIVKTDKKTSDKKRTRWQKISEAAAKQCGRGIIPEINEIISFKDASEYLKSMDYSVIAYENEKDYNLYNLADDIKNYFSENRHLNNQCKITEKFRKDEKKSIGILIGPEGGFSEEEVETFKNLDNVKTITLGNRILRTETAGFYALSIILFLLEGLFCQ